VWLVHLGRRTGLLGRIVHKPVSINELVSATSMHPPAVRAWCSAAVAYGLVRQKGGKIFLKPEIRSMLLDRKNPDYLGGQFSYLALRSLEYGGFERLFRLGRTHEMSSTLDAIEEATDWEHYAFIAAVRQDKRLLHQQLSRGCRLLDVGCGTGSFLVKMKKEYSNSSFVGMDRSAKAIASARKVARGKSIKITKQAGESMLFENEFDIVYLGESLYAARDKQMVVSNCRRALKNGGTIAIVEGLLPASNLQSSEDMLIMGMQLDFALQGHRFMTKKEVARLLAKFSRLQFKGLGGSVFLITATK
jgi:ubiquinone/menaquinone biosynthesis C-methylase UbiE